jgi:YjbE family integral membrane protein
VEAEFLSRLLGIVLVDLVLSGDNAVVIGMAARRLPPAQRRRAIIIGGGAAIALRILFTAIAGVLLRVPLLQFLGGLLLVVVALKLLRPSGAGENVREGRNLLDAIRVIVLADVVMSLDNMLSVAAVARESLLLLIAGLLISIPLLLLGSGVVATLMNRLPWLVWVGALVLAYTAGSMMVEDRIAATYLEAIPRAGQVVPVLVTAFVVVVGGLLARRASRGEARQGARLADSTPGDPSH